VLFCELKLKNDAGCLHYEFAATYKHLAFTFLAREIVSASPTEVLNMEMKPAIGTSIISIKDAQRSGLRGRRMMIKFRQCNQSQELQEAQSLFSDALKRQIAGSLVKMRM
jgi:hypothetical protein